MNWPPIAAILFLSVGAAAAQPPLRLKARVNSGRPMLHHPVTREGTHFILQFRAYPDLRMRTEVTRRGIQVLEYVPQNGLLVACPAFAWEGIVDIVSAGPVEASDKISPLLQRTSSGALLVEFFADVEMAHARAEMATLRLEVIENGSVLTQQLVVLGPHNRIDALAERDEVKYILPAPAELAAGEPMAACGGALSEAGGVGDYVLAGTGWPKDAAGNVDLKYFIRSFSDKLDPNTARFEIDRALREWTRYAKVAISPGMREGDERSIDILFARGIHGDAYPFDGPGGVLGHAFYPAPPNQEPVAGDMHLDADEVWRIGSSVDLFSVVLHEAGHALGLGHSDQPGAVMYPYYKLSSGLTNDDIAAIRAVYGSVGTGNPSPPAPTPTPTPTPTPPPVPIPTPTPSPGVPDTAPPSLTIVSPGRTIVSTTSSSLAFSGTAGDNVGVVSVKWSNSTGDSGIASGTTDWKVTVPLLTGTNVVIIRAYDAAGNSSWRSVTVVRY
jgi:hypothetical protein